MDDLPNILLVEDNPDHAELTLRCLEDHPIESRVLHVVDGEAALDFLLRRDSYSDPDTSPRPQMILLDLRLPKVDGLEVLESVKASNDLRRIPVVVLTTSQAEQDVTRAYELHANSYLVKPIDFGELSSLLDDLVSYWLSWNRRPAV